jgi:outer membrane immunogenic protein
MMRNLKLIVSAAAVVSTLVGITAATAADLPARTYTKAPVYVEPAFNWSGFYVGGNIGYSWGRSSNTAELSNFATGAPLFMATSRNDVNGVIGGAQFGYNWQMSNWVVGFEADLQGSGEKGSTTFICDACSPGGNITSELSQNLNWFGTIRGRAGILVTPTILLYGTGGLAYGEVDTGGSATGTNINGAPVSVFFPGVNSTRVGWTAGAGIEGRISGNWTLKLEYLYMDLGTVSGGPFASGIASGRFLSLGSSYSSHFTDNMVRVGFNYLLNAPVVARY